MLKRILVLINCIGLMIPLYGCAAGSQALLEFEKAIAGLT